MLKTIQNMVYPCPKDNPFPWPDPCDRFPRSWSAETGKSETGSDVVVTAAVGPIQPCPDGPTRPYPGMPEEDGCRLDTVSHEVFDPVDTNIMDVIEA